ncbi:MAG: Ig-like domain-containing protein [Gemmatimonadaceae bacterium]
MQRHLGAIALPLFGMLLSACSGGGDATVTPPAVSTVTVTAPSGTVAVGSTLQLTAVPKDANGNVLTGLAQSWSTSDQSHATVNATGLVSGVAAGPATISATVSGVTGSLALTVTAAVISANATVDATPNLVFDPAQVDITQGGTVTWRFGTVTHNVTFNGTAAGTPANIDNTTSASKGATFTTAGAYPYHCTLHPGMNGTVIVH